MHAQYVDGMRGGSQGVSVGESKEERKDVGKGECRYIGRTRVIVFPALIRKCNEVHQ